MRKVVERTRQRIQSNRDQRAQIAARVPYLTHLEPPSKPHRAKPIPGVLEIATYNVHRWAGVRGGRKWNPELATRVIAELDSDVIALQEVLRPFRGPDPLEQIVEDLGLYVAFGVSRAHWRGELGNAILTRVPIESAFALDLNTGSFERRSAIAARLHGRTRDLTIVATHLALLDRTRHKQVKSILAHPDLQGPTLLIGDMNAWRRCRATRRLNDNFTQRHHNEAWPATYPSPMPVLALDRIYTRGTTIQQIRSHVTPASRYGSDHLPLVATIRLGEFTLVEHKVRQARASTDQAV